MGGCPTCTPDRHDLEKFKNAADSGYEGLGHFWGNLQTLWRQGVDLMTKYSGMGTCESGLDMVDQECGRCVIACLLLCVCACSCAGTARCMHL